MAFKNVGDAHIFLFIRVLCFISTKWSLIIFEVLTFFLFHSTIKAKLDKVKLFLKRTDFILRAK